MADVLQYKNNPYIIAKLSDLDFKMHSKMTLWSKTLRIFFMIQKSAKHTGNQNPKCWAWAKAWCKCHADCFNTLEHLAMRRMMSMLHRDNTQVSQRLQNKKHSGYTCRFDHHSIYNCNSVKDTAYLKWLLSILANSQVYNTVICAVRNVVQQTPQDTITSRDRFPSCQYWTC